MNGREEQGILLVLLVFLVLLILLDLRFLFSFNCATKPSQSSQAVSASVMSLEAASPAPPGVTPIVTAIQLLLT